MAQSDGIHDGIQTINSPRRFVATLVGTAVGVAAATLTTGASAPLHARAATPCGQNGALSSGGTCTYTQTGADTFTVPDTVTQVTFDVFGGAGGPVGYGDPRLLGGLGGEAKATLSVKPGTVFQVNVGSGGNGGNTQGVSGSGGSGGGGNAGADGGGAGGGGASDVRSGSYGLADRIVVAGGGGGAGGVGFGFSGAGGDGGGGNGSAGTTNNPDLPGAGVGSGGFGATTGGPGAGGSGGGLRTGTGEGQPGSGALGGAGAAGGGSTSGGGGGGGGYYGGGGGGAGYYGGGGGGGGGSSYVTPSAVTSTLTAGQQPGSGRIVVSWVGPDHGLGLTVPANITVDATTSQGASVTYVATATDEPGDDPAASVHCDPASGSTFPIGVTTVSCTATDDDDANSPVKATFTVTVKGAAQQLSDLVAAVQGVGSGTSLADKVRAAQAYLNAGDIPDTCSTLSAFIREVQAQSGKSIPAAQASQLVADAQRIQAVLAC